MLLWPCRTPQHRPPPEPGGSSVHARSLGLAFETCHPPQAQGLEGRQLCQGRGEPVGPICVGGPCSQNINRMLGQPARARQAARGTAHTACGQETPGPRRAGGSTWLLLGQPPGRLPKQPAAQAIVPKAPPLPPDLGRAVAMPAQTAGKPAGCLQAAPGRPLQEQLHLPAPACKPAAPTPHSPAPAYKPAAPTPHSPPPAYKPAAPFHAACTSPGI